MGIPEMRAQNRIIQESVPGKQITLAHVVASPTEDIYERIGIDENGAIGILTLTPVESAIIAADMCTKAADVELGFLDRFTGSVILTGDVAAVTEALNYVTDAFCNILGFDVVAVTRS